MLDYGPIVKHVKPGDKIKIKERLHGEENAKYITYKVVKVYPHMVLAEKKNHSRRCFSYGDLVIAGLEKQSAVLEARRTFTVEDLRRRENNKPYARGK